MNLMQTLIFLMIAPGDSHQCPILVGGQGQMCKPIQLWRVRLQGSGGVEPFTACQMVVALDISNDVTQAGFYLACGPSG